MSDETKLACGCHAEWTGERWQVAASSFLCDHNQGDPVDGAVPLPGQPDLLNVAKHHAPGVVHQYLVETVAALAAAEAEVARLREVLETSVGCWEEDARGWRDVLSYFNAQPDADRHDAKELIAAIEQRASTGVRALATVAARPGTVRISSAASARVFIAARSSREYRSVQLVAVSSRSRWTTTRRASSRSASAARPRIVVRGAAGVEREGRLRHRGIRTRRGCGGRTGQATG